MDLDVPELEARLIYSIVAGKSAKFADAVMRRWVQLFVRDRSCFEALRELSKNPGELEKSFREVRTGNYGKMLKACEALTTAKLDLATCGPEDLEKIPGIGPKTSRFFILWTRPTARYAALDVHVLRWMRNKGYNVPRQTPGDRKVYARIETWFLAEADRAGKSPAVLDAEIWEAGSKSSNNIPELCHG